MSPLLSRCVLLTLEQLGPDQIRDLIHRALADGRGLAGAVTLAADAEDHLVRLSAGDARNWDTVVFVVVEHHLEHPVRATISGLQSVRLWPSNTWKPAWPSAVKSARGTGCAATPAS